MPHEDGRFEPAPGVTVFTNCPSCGSPISADAKFCSECGSRTQQFAVVTPPGPDASSAGVVATPPAVSAPEAGAVATPPGVSAPEAGAATPSSPEPGAASQSPIVARLAGELAGRYTITRELGRGGMATVFLATDVKHGRDVAIKVLHPELSASIGGERFEREIRLVANLQHPNVLGLYDSGAANGLLYYVMPFVDGESLRDKITREGQLSVDDAIRIILDVASALGYAHGKGIIHRDIKPENILLSGELTLVADFGIAKAASEANQQKLTQTGMAVGTPLYMAPEQAGGEAVGPTADIYSLGCMLYEMLSGEPPFTGKNPVAIMARHAMEQVPSIRIVRSSVVAEVEEAIFAAMGKVPADRPQTASAFAEILGIPLGATSTMRVRGRTSMYAAVAPVPWWKKKPVLAAATVAVAIAAGAGWYNVNSRNSAAAILGPDARRIAVLYFQDRSRDSSLVPLADGLTEGLIRTLGTSPSLRVISQSGVEPYRGSDLAPDSIARALRVGILVRGEVEPEGQQIRVSVRLDDHSGVNLRRASFLKPGDNLPAIQDTLPAVVADLIKQQLREEITLRDQRASTSSQSAWLLLQRAEHSRKRAEELARAGESDAVARAFDTADSLLQLTEREDRRWADAPTLRAQIAYRRSRLAGRDLPEIRRWTEVGLEHVERALALDPRHSDALEVRGNLKYWSALTVYQSDPARSRPLVLSARDDFERATSVNPRQAGAFASLAHLYNNTNTVAEANIAAQRALEADEFLENAEVVLQRLFLSSFDLGLFEKADQACSEANRRFAASLFAARCQLFMLTTRVRNPDVAAAWRLADSVVTLTPVAGRDFAQHSARMLVATVLARASRSDPALADSARRVPRAAEGDDTIDPNAELGQYASFVYATLGDMPNLRRTLRRYIAASPMRADGLREEPPWWFREAASDPQVKRLIGAE
jgi:eukaryotic-like serine/threonine-protein kinase